MNSWFFLELTDGISWNLTKSLNIRLLNLWKKNFCIICKRWHIIIKIDILEHLCCYDFFTCSVGNYGFYLHEEDILIFNGKMLNSLLALFQQGYDSESWALKSHFLTVKKLIFQLGMCLAVYLFGAPFLFLPLLATVFNRKSWKIEPLFHMHY